MSFSRVFGTGLRFRTRPVRLGTALALAALAATPQGVLAQAAQTTGVGSQFELTFWQSVESGSDPALYEAYLAQYPNGTFAAVARVKLAKLRQTNPASPATAQPAVVQPTPVQSAPVLPTPTQAQPAPAIAAPPPTPVVTAQAPVAAPPPALAKPATKFVAAAPAPAPPGVPATRERRAGAAPVARASALPPSAGDAESTPYITPAPPVEPAGESEDSVALRRLLGALGDSQRAGAPPPAPIVDVAEPAANTVPLAPETASVPVTAPSASPPRLVQTAMPTPQPALGPPIVVADAVALSATSTVAADPHPIAVGPLPAGFALPPRPQLTAIPPLAFPVSFCSAESRNAFHDGPYIAAVEAAKRNNDAAIAYLRLLQDLYNTNQLSGDINPVNAIAAESRAYGPVAAAAFSAQSTLVGAFSTLMAVPIQACNAPTQP